MFSLHESTQRLVCRVLFILCAVLPVLGTSGFVLYSLRPWAEYDWQHSLSQQLHMQVEVQTVHSPRPCVHELSGVRISDLRSHKPLANIDKVRISWQHGRLALAIDRLELHQSHLKSLANSLSTTLTASELPPARVEAKHVLVVGSQLQQLELANLHMQVATNDSTRRMLKIECEPLDPSKQAHLPMLHLDISRRDCVTTASLDTGGGHLPVWLLTDLWPSLANCTEASFAGRIVLSGAPTTSKGSLRGRIDNIDFASWLGDGSPLSLTGNGQLLLDDLRWQDQRIEVVHASLQAPSGTASRSLLAKMQQLLSCQLGTVATPGSETVDPNLVPFDELNCAFHLTESGLTLLGRCQSIQDGAPGCVLAWRGEPVLKEPTYNYVPLGRLVRVLSHPAASWTGWLPAWREANEMARSLPLPRVGPQPESDKQEVASQPKESTSR